MGKGIDFLNRMRGKTTQPAAFKTLSDGSFWTYYNISNFATPDKLDLNNGYIVGSELSEVFFCVDTIAEKVASLFSNVYIVNSAGSERPLPSNLKKLFSKPNIFDKSITDLIYNFVFSELTDGNGYIYFKCPEGSERVTKENVQAIMMLDPTEVEIKLKGSERDYLTAAKISDYIKHYKDLISGDEIKPEFILHSKSYIRNRTKTDFRGLSPLYAAKRNVDNLLAVYSARNNVYVNNGVAYIITPDKPASGNDPEAIVNPINRDDIIRDMNNRYGLTGDKAIKAVSSIPLKGLNTLVTIKDLQPFDETDADFRAIAGVYGVDKDLLPLKEGTTFTNKEVAESKLWADTAIPMALDICQDFTQMFGLVNEKIMVRTDNIGFLQAQRKTELESDKVEIENIKSLSEAGADVERINMLIDNILKKYEA